MHTLVDEFSSPIIISNIEVLRVEDRFFVRSMTEDGVTGIAFTDQRIPYLLPILQSLVIPYFIGKDARCLESLIDEVYIYRSNYKYAGMAFWDCVAHVEFSLLDALGKSAGKSVGQLLGPVLRPEIPVYLSSLRRDTVPEEEVGWLEQRLAETKAGAVKLKIGGRMSMNADASPGRTDRLIPLARQTFGDDVTIYVDANGSYDAQHAIEVGRLLEEYQVGFFEEPCPFEDYMAIKTVADTLQMTVAGGEQDTSLPHFRWMIENQVVDLVQPDLAYNGGFVRCLRVAQMADAAGMKIAPHSPKSDVTAAYMLHFASIVPNLWPHQEFRGEPRQPDPWASPTFEIRNGTVQVPSGPGFGITYDSTFLESALVL